MKTRSLLALLAIATLTAFTPFGGWATITMDPYPSRVAIGRPLNLAFVVKQHGVTPLAGLKPRIEATAPGQKTVKANATAEKEVGRYSGTIRLPKTGEWTVTVVSGFRTSQLVLPPIQVTDAKEIVQATRRP